MNAPPDTGGMRATTSPSASLWSTGAYSLLTAYRSPSGSLPRSSAPQTSATRSGSISRCDQPARSRSPAKSLTVTRTASSLPSYMAAMDERLSESGIAIKPVYTPDDAPPPAEPPGVPPFTRGIYPDMYRGRPWTIRQYAGFASAEESNARYRYLLAQGQTGLSVAFDLPTQLGLDSDDLRAEGEVGRTGVAIDSLADMEVLLDAIPLDRVSTSMTINAPAALLLLLYELVAQGQGVDPAALRGTV